MARPTGTGRPVGRPKGSGVERNRLIAKYLITARDLDAEGEARWQEVQADPVRLARAQEKEKEVLHARVFRAIYLYRCYEIDRETCVRQIMLNGKFLEEHARQLLVGTLDRPRSDVQLGLYDPGPPPPPRRFLRHKALTRKQRVGDTTFYEVDDPLVAAGLLGLSGSDGRPAKARSISTVI